MKIQFNTDKTISGEERQEEYFSNLIAKELDRFNAHLTRVEVHLKDENGHKENFKDIHCVLEARLEGKKPIAAKDNGTSVSSAVTGATMKLKAALTTAIGRTQNH